MKTASEIVTAIIAQINAGTWDRGDELLLGALADQGIARPLAHRALAFVQLSCGHRYLEAKGCGVPAAYLLMLADGGSVGPLPLNMEPFYSAAQRLVVPPRIGQAAFEALALTSGPGQCFLQLTGSGSTPNDLVFTEPCMFVDPLDRDLLASLAGVERADDLATPSRSPWLRFWRS